MEINQICTDFISFINSETKYVKDLLNKIKRIDSLCALLINQQKIPDFKKSPYLTDVVQAILSMCTQITKFKSKDFDPIYKFFSLFSVHNILLAKEEKDTQELVKIMINIITNNVPNADEECWTFWLKIFIEIFKIPTFYTLFKEKSDEEIYLNIDNLFSLVKSLMKFEKDTNNEFYSNQRTLALNLFSVFLEKSPFNPTSELIDSIFQIASSFSNLKLNDFDFNILLKILNKLVILSPTTFLVDLSSPFQTPFNDQILNHIFEIWKDLKRHLSIRKSSSVYLLLFLITMDSLNYELPQSFIDNWVKLILDFWSQQANKGKIFESSEFIPYLRADIEFLKRSNDSSISKCLLQYILPKNKIKQNSNIIWLFTAIGKYCPQIVDQEDWIQILKAVQNFNFRNIVLQDNQDILDFYGLISVMVDVIDSKSEWNKVFEFLINNQSSRDQFYILLAKILKEQKIDTKVAHQNQKLLWNDKSVLKNYSLEKLRCIHILIFYYGFENNDKRNDCFNTLISLLSSEDSFSKEYLKQFSLTICSIISSYPLPFIPLKQEEKTEEIYINNICNLFKQQLEITTKNKTKIEAPIQTEDLYFITPESSQISVEEGPEFETDSYSYSSQINDSFFIEKNNSSKNNNNNEQTQFALCNFISKEMQKKSFIKNILTENIKNESNQCYFRIFLTSKMPTFFTPSSFLECFEKSFIEKGDVDTFPSFCETLLTIIDEFRKEDFQPFFEHIEETFFTIAQQYIRACESRIHDFISQNSPISWDVLISSIDEFNDILIFVEFAVKCSFYSIEKSDNFYNCLEDFLSTTIEIPILHLKICSYLLNLSLSEHQKARIISSLEKITSNVLNVLFVPFKDRDNFLIDLFNTIKYEYSRNLEDLFKCIYKYSVTPVTKLNLLTIIKNNYKKCSQIFDCLFESENYSPYFINDDYPTIRIQSIDTIISILKLREIYKFDGYVVNTERFDKVEFFNEKIVPFVEKILNEEGNCKQKIFTAIKTLIQIASEIPELTIKCLYIIFEAFTHHDYTIFPKQFIYLLFSCLSNRSHFSIFLRQFIPLLIPQLEKLTDSLSSYPFDLFYFDKEKVTKNEAKRLFCEKAAPYVIAYSYVNSKQEMINFFTSSLNKNEDEIKSKYAEYIASYLLISITEDFTSSTEDLDYRQNLYDELMINTKFESPIPLISFVSMANNDSIQSSYQKILMSNNINSDFCDIRNTVYHLYSKIYKSHHELIQSHYLQQFSLYISILFENHKDEINEKTTLYSDILALTVNMLDYVPTMKSLQLLLDISDNIPENFIMQMVGFVKNIENICSSLGFHPCLDNFFERFPELIDEMLIFDFLKERQLENRTALMEFQRIAKTKRLNQQSINFLLSCFSEDSDSIESINNLSSYMKRTVLNEIYNFALLNPQSLALHLYSEMFLNFISIHPSPLIIDRDLNSPIYLFQNLLELARDKNPSTNRSALTALHIILDKKMLPNPVKNDSLLYLQLEQYSHFSHPRKKVKKIDEDSPWICKFVCNYISQMNEDQVCKAFESVAACSPEFCKKLFPHLFSECLDSPLFDSIYGDFKRFSEDPLKYLDECKLFIESFNYLKAIIFQNHKSDGPNSHLYWHQKQFDFQKIMEVCLKIGDPYSAYIYAEFAHEAVKMNDEPLNRIFSNIGVNDLKYGLNCNFSNLLSVAEFYNQSKQQAKALVLYDIDNNDQKIANTLCDLHLYNLLNKLKIPKSEKNIECLWRLRKWDVSSEIVRDMDLRSRSANLFTVMQAFATNNEDVICNKLNDFAHQFHFDLNSSVFDQLSYLLDASSLSLFQAVLFKNSSKLHQFFPEKIIEIYQHSLKKLENLSHQFFDITESANALNGVFFCILSDLKSSSSTSLKEIPPKFFSDVISNSLENNQIGAAQYFISLLHESQKKVPQFVNFEQIRVLYASNPHHAVSLFDKSYDQILLKEGQLDDEDLRNHFNLRLEFTKASWNAHTNSLLSGQIYGQLEDVIQKVEKANLVDLLADAEFTLARVYQRQQREVQNYFLSPEYATIVSIVKEERENLKKEHILTKEARVQMKTDYSNYIEIINNYKKLFSLTIIKSIEHFMKALKYTSKYDLESTFSIINIWFNYSYTKHKAFIQNVPNLIETMEIIFKEINPAKFLPLFYQIAARIDNLNEKSTSQDKDYSSSFQAFLRIIATLICEKSPNDCFPILFQLQKSDGQSQRFLAIRELIDSISTRNKELSDNWKQMSYLLKSYINLVAMSNDQPATEEVISKCTFENMPYLSIITLTKFVGISKFDLNFEKLDGNSKPLLLHLFGTDGHIYSQILKSDKDDLRQDAVMQQLFVLSSKLLAKKNPNLSIRFYKVVPITATTGVIEFVEGSISILQYLKKAHKHYYVQGESLNLKRVIIDFKDKSEQYHSYPKKTDEERSNFIKFFKMIRKNLMNVFHFFFIENFSNPADWFVSRLRYSRHTATNSMIGHIFGIGDRHLNNILIDIKTGEVIHIDLGIAFDQGKALPVMEIVPFRLTDEIVDGMGWMGKERIFRKNCEESLFVLRNSAEYLLTVLEVLMSDPLYTWILVPKKKIVNDAISDDKLQNKFAESVMVTCQRKLEGRENGESLSVEGQVSKLINDATSDENLALMFTGWKPYL